MIQKSPSSPWVISPHLDLLLAKITAAHGRALLVGGCVRDHLMGQVAKDLDLEVYGLSTAKLEAILHHNFSVVAVGKAFGIFKVLVKIKDTQESFDVALPRRENKVGIGHKGFSIDTDETMTFAQAALRRDFTINAMGLDPKTNELFDPHGGLADLKKGILRHICDAFAEDPLRVLRGAQFCSRFGFKLHEDTVLLCRSLKNELFTLSTERIFQEMKKLLLGKTPSRGLETLAQTHSLELFPELKALMGCEQEQEWHPEGDVWVHSLMVCDKAAQLVAQADLSEDEKLIIITGALCHDLGKPSCTLHKDGRIKSPGHEQAGVVPTLSFLAKIGFPKKYEDEVISLVKEHLKPFQLYAKKDEVSDGAIRRLCTRVNIEHLLYVSQADFLGRTTKDALSGHDPSAPWLRQKVQEILGEHLSPKPIILGRHLIALGQKPGPNFASILKQAFEAQLDGEFSTEEAGVIWLTALLARN